MLLWLMNLGFAGGNAAAEPEVRMILAGITLTARFSGELTITPRISGTPDLSQGEEP